MHGFAAECDDIVRASFLFTAKEAHSLSSVVASRLAPVQKSVSRPLPGKITTGELQNSRDALLTLPRLAMQNRA